MSLLKSGTYYKLGTKHKNNTVKNNHYYNLNQNRQELILEISKKIKLQEFAIFCGAGISLNSGLPIVTQFLNYVLESIDVEKVHIEKILNSNLPF